MISKSNLDQQLQRIHFNGRGWGRSEVHELCSIMMPDEEIDECVNGFYESGFALLVATKERLVIVDKKPLNYLTVEDMRFDMINEFDYSHRLVGAEIRISSGMKTLKFSSLNQSRLRRLLGFAQYRMAEMRKQQHSHQEAQKMHLEQLNQQLQVFLAIQQYQYQQLAQSGKLGNTAAPMLSLKDMAAAAGRSGTDQLSEGQVGLAGIKRVIPVISAYTRLPLMSQRWAGLAKS